MEIKLISRVINEIAHKQGFWADGGNIGEKLMLIVSEVSEALEAHRNGKFTNAIDAAWMDASVDESQLYSEHFPKNIKNTFEDELADIVIRVFDLAFQCGIDIEFHIKHKVNYNRTRPYKNGKAY